MVPEIVTAVATLIFFTTIAGGPLRTILIAHITFCIPSPTSDLGTPPGDRGELRLAARDLYATRWQAFRLVLLPLMMPGVISGWLLASSSASTIHHHQLRQGAGMETLPTAIFDR